MTDHTLASLRKEFDRISARLSEAQPADRAALKADIVALFKRTEQSIDELSTFKETIRDLIDRFKTLPDSGTANTTVRHDHIGASSFIERGWTAFAAGEWRRAEMMLRDALGIDARNDTAQALLGWALSAQGRGDEALQLCLQVLLRQPEDGLARTAVGVICLRKGITGEAIEHLSRAARSPGDARSALYANYWLGVAYLEREMPTAASDVLRRAIELGPNLAEGWAELGRAEWLQGRHDSARDAWMRGSAIRHSPFAARAIELSDLAAQGGQLPRSPLA